MNLSADLFAECTVALTKGAVPVPHPSPGERRRCCRIELARASVPMTRVVNGQQQPAQVVRVRDFSARGINVLYPQCLPSGDQFVIHISRADGTTISILCTVAHSRPYPEDKALFSVGAEFTCVLRDTATPAASSTAEATGKDRAAALARIRQSVLNNN
jgi:hypothetical protein